MSVVGIAAVRHERVDGRLKSASAGLRAARAATAFRRLTRQEDLTSFDKETLRRLTRDLRTQADALEASATADIADEDASFALAGITLSALSETEHAPTTEGDHDHNHTAASLRELAQRLERVLNGEIPDEASLQTLEAIFVTASDLVGASARSTGESAEGEADPSQ